MSSKKKARPVYVPPDSSDHVALAGHAASALGASHHKDAIEHFKNLLKRERRSEWLEGLAAAYAGRAEQLAGKGMLKEALALWRTRSDACAVPMLGGPYVGWLLESGQVEQALGLLVAADKLPPEAQAAAHTQLAAAVLAAPDSLLTGLPADSPLLQHRAAAKAALAACARGDETALADALQAISFHSPYRDLRVLLRALTLQATDPQGAAQALARVPAKGPFEPLAQALRVSLMQGGEWLAGLRQLGDAGRALVLDLKGCPESQRPVVFDLLARLDVSASMPLALFDLLLRQRRAIGDDMARQLCLRLLPHAPQRLDVFRASFRPLAPPEQERVLALAAELKQQPEQAEGHWLRLVKLLGNEPDGPRRAALVLRRLADEHALHAPEGEMCSHAQDWLAQSLDLDPADRGTHLRLIRDARLRGDLKPARARLDAARKRFPEDAPLLQEAVEIALGSGAFKKAAGLAKQVLQVDPINPRVRALIGQAHLAHARKQIDAHNLQAARRELDEAATWLRSAGEHGLVNLLRGFAAESAAASDALWRDAVAQLGGPLIGAFHLLIESKRAKTRPALEPKGLLRRAGVDMAATPSAAEVVSLAQALNTLPEHDAALRSTLGVLRGMLERAASALRFGESEHLLVCEALSRHALDDLTRRFAQAALERWPRRLVFVYLEAQARFGAQPRKMPRREWERLDEVYQQAQDQGDQRTAARLGKLLDKAAGGPSGDELPSDQDEFGAADVGAVMNAMLALGGEDSILDMARGQLGKPMFEQLRREVGGGKKQFAQALVKLLTLGELELGRPTRIVPPKKSLAPSAAPTAKNQPDFFND